MAKIESILGLPSLVDTFEMHKLITAGFPPETLKALARELGIAEKHVIEWATGKPALPRKANLSTQASDLAYRLASCLSQLQAKGLTAQQASLWMRNHQPALKGEIPILLVKSYHGYTYVLVAIERI